MGSRMSLWPKLAQSNWRKRFILSIPPARHEQGAWSPSCHKEPSCSPEENWSSMKNCRAELQKEPEFSVIHRAAVCYTWSPLYLLLYQKWTKADVFLKSIWVEIHFKFKHLPKKFQISRKGTIGKKLQVFLKYILCLICLRNVSHFLLKYVNVFYVGNTHGPCLPLFLF